MLGSNQITRRFCLSLLGLALLVRAMLPQGFMPVAAPDGVRMVMCGGSGPVTLQIDREGKQHRDSSDQKSSACPYAIAGTGADLASPPRLPAAPLPDTATARHQFIAAKLAAWHALRPPARGPPHLA